jgi:hypothetical protein
MIGDSVYGRVKTGLDLAVGGWHRSSAADDLKIRVRSLYGLSGLIEHLPILLLPRRYRQA